MEPEGSLPHLQVHATCAYPQPDQSSPCPHMSLTEDPSCTSITSSKQTYRMFILSLHRTRQLYRIERLYPSGHPVTASVFRTAPPNPKIKNAWRLFFYSPPYVFSVWWLNRDRHFYRPTPSTSCRYS